MGEKITYSYYTSAQASQNSFFRLPRALYEKECFRGLSNDAKTLYALMLDRMSLSLANEWLDEDGKVYINYSLEDIMTTLNCGKTKAVALLKELDSESGIGLIEKKNMGIAKASVFYVMNFVCEEEISEEEVCSEIIEVDNEAVDNSVPRVRNMNSVDTPVFENRTHACPENEHDRVQNLNPNKNNINKTNMSKTNPILSINLTQEDAIEEMEGYSEIIKENIDYDSLLLAHPYDREMVEGIFELILETVLSKNEEITIAGDVYPKNLVKSKFLKLNY
ncbi:MAG: replication initiator protein A, partial [Lachnospiraceae bacterium]|nr:replication initiator protein A [Lachnospiraceae bacterium]